jgi:hypothetical protein
MMVISLNEDDRANIGIHGVECAEINALVPGLIWREVHKEDGQKYQTTEFLIMGIAFDIYSVTTRDTVFRQKKISKSPISRNTGGWGFFLGHNGGSRKKPSLRVRAPAGSRPFL